MGSATIDELAEKMRVCYDAAVDADSEDKRDIQGAYPNYMQAIAYARMLAEIHPNREIRGQYFTHLVNMVDRAEELRKIIVKRMQQKDKPVTASAAAVAVAGGAGTSNEDLEAEARKVAEAMIENLSHAADWDDVKGMHEAKERMEEALLYRKEHPEFFKNSKGWSAVLLYGVPGTGKTTVAKAMAKKLGYTFINVKLADIRQKYVGSGEKIIRQAFVLARERQPSIIFVDEVDGILSHRTGEAKDDTITNSFIGEINGVNEHPEAMVVTIGATNKPDAIDSAMWRRFEARVKVPTPDAETRKDILLKMLDDWHVGHSVTEEEAEAFARASDGYTGSDIEQIVRAAALGIVKDTRNATRFHLMDNEKYRAVAPCAACDPKEYCQWCDSEPMTFQNLGEANIQYDRISNERLITALHARAKSVQQADIDRIDRMESIHTNAPGSA